MIRAVSLVEKNCFSEPIPPVVVLTNVSTKVLESVRKRNGCEFVARYIQNVGANTAYYNFDETCDNVTNFRGMLAPTQQLDVSNFPGYVTVYVTGGSTFSITQLVRNDMATHTNIISGNQGVMQ